NAAYAPADQALREIQLAHAPRDMRLRVRVTLNTFHEDFWLAAASLPPVAGAMAWRVNGDGTMAENGWRDGWTMVLLGDWREERDGEQHWLTAPGEHGPELAGRTVLVTVTGDRARAQDYLARIDWARLRGLLTP
ncbi:MAG TPA: hypothetical protein PKM88_06090, partial [bacterium]|nr:hypothetical protein [bacterium]